MMPSIGGFSISVTANTAALNTGFKKASKLTNGLRGSIGKLGMGIAAIGAPVSLIAGLTAVVRIGADFEKQMSNVKSAVNASGDSCSGFLISPKNLERQRHFRRARPLPQ